MECINTSSRFRKYSKYRRKVNSRQSINNTETSDFCPQLIEKDKENTPSSL